MNKNKLRKNNQFYARKIHRFLGVFYRYSFVFWTIRFAIFSWTDIDLRFMGDQFTKPHDAINPFSDLVNPLALVLFLGKSQQ